MARKKHFIPKKFVDEYQKHHAYLSGKYGISTTTVYRWRRAIQNNERWKLQQDIPITGRMLGILWSLGGDAFSRFVVRHQERDIIEKVRIYFGIDTAIVKAESNTGVQWKIYLTGHVRDVVLAELERQGWSVRNADVREYPQSLPHDQHRDFILTYIELHGGLDYPLPRKKPRLRIYGNRVLLQQLNTIIPQLFGVAPKTPQRVTEKTYCLYYQNQAEIVELWQKPF